MNVEVKAWRGMPLINCVMPLFDILAGDKFVYPDFLVFLQDININLWRAYTHTLCLAPPVNMDK